MFPEKNKNLINPFHQGLFLKSTIAGVLIISLLFFEKCAKGDPQAPKPNKNLHLEATPDTPKHASLLF